MTGGSSLNDVDGTEKWEATLAESPAASLKKVNSKLSQLAVEKGGI